MPWSSLFEFLFCVVSDNSCHKWMIRKRQNFETDSFVAIASHGTAAVNVLQSAIGREFVFAKHFSTNDFRQSARSVSLMSRSICPSLVLPVIVSAGHWLTHCWRLGMERFALQLQDCLPVVKTKLCTAPKCDQLPQS